MTDVKTWAELDQLNIVGVLAEAKEGHARTDHGDPVKIWCERVPSRDEYALYIVKYIPQRGSRYPVTHQAHIANGDLEWTRTEMWQKLTPALRISGPLFKAMRAAFA